MSPLIAFPPILPRVPGDSSAGTAERARKFSLLLEFSAARVLGPALFSDTVFTIRFWVSKSNYLGRLNHKNALDTVGQSQQLRKDFLSPVAVKPALDKAQLPQRIWAAFIPLAPIRDLLLAVECLSGRHDQDIPLSSTTSKYQTVPLNPSDKLQT